MLGRHSFLLSLALFLGLLSPLPTHAETKVLTAEATYTMGDGETPSFAEAMALQKAKQMALEQAGTYVESYTKVQNYTLTADEIQTIAGGVLQVEILERKRELIGDGLRHYVKINATVTTDKIADLAQRIKGKSVAEEYKKLQEEYARLSREIETWKNLIAKTPRGMERDTALNEIREREKAFQLVQEREAALFTRVISGETLVMKAQNERDLVDALVRKILEQGHLIGIGEPESHHIADNPNKVSIHIPLTVQVNRALIPVIQETAQTLGGNPQLLDVPGLNERYAAHRVKLAEDRNVILYILRKWPHLSLRVNVELKDGSVLSCPAWRLWELKITGSNWRGLGARQRLFGLFEFSDETGEILFWSNSFRVIVSFEVPTEIAKQIQSINAQYKTSSPDFFNLLEGFLTPEERKQIGMNRDGTSSPLVQIENLEYLLWSSLAHHPAVMTRLGWSKKEFLKHMEKSFSDPSDLDFQRLSADERQALKRLWMILEKRQFAKFMQSNGTSCQMGEAK